MCCFGVMFVGDEHENGKITKETSLNVSKYCAVFADLCSYYPALNYDFSNLEIALACAMCARRKFQIVPQNS